MSHACTSSSRWGPSRQCRVLPTFSVAISPASSSTLRCFFIPVNDIPVTKCLRHGKAGPEIVAQSKEHDYDAILLGARGVGRVGALVGSVSSYVMHHADTAVFVAHAPNR